MSERKGQVTGIGGVFFKSGNPAGLKQWYAEQLGLATNEYGSLFEFREAAEPHRTAYLQWSPFKADTTYFEPSEQPFMINYRVDDLEALVERLRADGVTVVDEIETFEYGKFVHVMDPEGNKIELWEPIDAAFAPDAEGKTTR